MNHFDLESKIKSVRVPERDAQFWQDLPQRVLARAQAAPERQPAPRRHCLFAILSSPFAVACLVLGLCLWQSQMPQAISRALLQDEREMRQTLAQFPARLDTLMRDEHGLHYLIQDPP
jgi:2-polyprenyl-6-methoxyphenol hydroxylase-like FAD-dependent oxidoreductase